MAFSQYQSGNTEKSADTVGIYLLTDGKPDTSMSLVLNEVREMNSAKNIIINTISFNCPDRYLCCYSLVSYSNRGHQLA